MKPWVKLVILFAALAVAVGACFVIIDIANHSNNVDPENDTTKLFVFSSNISSFSYSFEGIDTTFSLENHIWVNKSDETMPLKQNDLDGIATLIKNGVESVRLVDDTGDLINSESFGLDAPSVILKATDGLETKILRVGNLNKAYNAYYANVEGSKEVHLIKPDIPETFLKTPTLLALEATEYPEYDYTDIVGISLFDDSLKRSFSYSKGGSEFLYSSTYEWFELDSTNKYSPLRTTAMTSLCGELYGFDDIVGVDYNPSAEKLAAYGFKKGNKGFSVSYNGEIDVENEFGYESVEAVLTIDVLFTDETDDGICYMMWTDNDCVYSISSEKVQTIMAYLTEDLIPDEVCLISIDSVDSFTVDYKDTNIVIIKTDKVITDEKGNKTTTQIYTANDIVADTNTVNVFFDKLHALTVESRADAGSWSSNETPCMTLNFYRNTDNFKEMSLYVYEYSVNFYRISFNGNDDILVSTRTIENMGNQILKTVNK